MQLTQAHLLPAVSGDSPEAIRRKVAQKELANWAMRVALLKLTNAPDSTNEAVNNPHVADAIAALTSRVSD